MVGSLLFRSCHDGLQTCLERFVEDLPMASGVRSVISGEENHSLNGNEVVFGGRSSEGQPSRFLFKYAHINKWRSQNSPKTLNSLVFHN